MRARGTRARVAQSESARDGGRPMPKARKRAKTVTPTHDSRGKFAKGNRLGPGPGRPKGIVETKPRKGTIRAVIEDLIETGRGHEKMKAAFDKGIQASPAIAVKYLDLAARVLDKAEDDAGGKHVHFTLITNVDFEKLRGAQSTAGLPKANR